MDLDRVAIPANFPTQGGEFTTHPRTLGDHESSGRLNRFCFRVKAEVAGPPASRDAEHRIALPLRNLFAPIHPTHVGTQSLNTVTGALLFQARQLQSRNVGMEPI
jgi:hypothetical protein